MRMVTNHEHKLHLQKKKSKKQHKHCHNRLFKQFKKKWNTKPDNGTYYQILMLWRKPKL